MKKTITITMIVILLLNLISVNSFATTYEGQLYDDTTKLDPTPQETGQVTIENDEGNTQDVGITGTKYSYSNGFKAVVSALTFVPQAINQILDMFVEATTENKVDKFTIYDTVMGHYDLFDIDYTTIPEKLGSNPTLIEQMKFYVIRYYGVTRRLSIAISLLVLIYIGIRMAVSTVASDKAKYKKMFIDWLASIVLVYLMYFIVIVISIVLQYGLDIVQNIATTWKVNSMELDIYNGAIENFTAKGFNVVTSVVIIYMLTWYQAKFFIYYLHRTLEVNFLIVVSPLVTITYSIDKAGDGKAQAFSTFIKEIIMKSVVQIIHAVVYVAFIATAGVIATVQPLLAILFFAALSRAEKIARKVFSIDEDGFRKVKLPFVE